MHQAIANRNVATKESFRANATKTPDSQLQQQHQQHHNRLFASKVAVLQQTLQQQTTLPTLQIKPLAILVAAGF